MRRILGKESRQLQTSVTASRVVGGWMLAKTITNLVQIYVN